MNARIEREVTGGLLTFPADTPVDYVEAMVARYEASEAQAARERREEAERWRRQHKHAPRDRQIKTPRIERREGDSND